VSFEGITAYAYMALGHWELPIKEIVKATVVPGDIFIDVGAHIGYYSQLGAKLVRETGIVICVEPDPFNIPILTEMFSHFRGPGYSGRQRAREKDLFRCSSRRIPCNRP
jgi:predicted methyltransferase